MRLPMLALAVLAFVTATAYAQDSHNHMNGDCQQICDLNCKSLVRSLEEMKGFGSCANYGYGMTHGVEARCGHNPPGSLVQNMNCDSNGDCQMWGTLKCTLPSGIKNYPTFDMTCYDKAGVMPRVEVLDTYVQCSYPDMSGFHATCSADGTTVLFGAW